MSDTTTTTQSTEWYDDEDGRYKLVPVEGADFDALNAAAEALGGELVAAYKDTDGDTDYDYIISPEWMERFQRSAKQYGDELVGYFAEVYLGEPEDQAVQA